VKYIVIIIKLFYILLFISPSKLSHPKLLKLGKKM